MEKKYTTGRSLWVLLRAVVHSIPLIIRTKHEPEEQAWQDAYEYVHYWCPKFMKVNGSRVIYHGLENLPEHGGVLYVGNHQSYIDIVVLLSVMEYPTAFINKKELDNAFYFGPLLRATGSVSLDRNDLRQSLNAMRLAGERMQKGLNMVVFPEGTRSKDGQVHEFKKGSLRPATETGSLVVPFRIDGSRDVLEGNPGFHARACEVHVYFGEPIDVSRMSRKEQHELADSMRDIVVGLK